MHDLVRQIVDHMPYRLLTAQSVLGLEEPDTARAECDPDHITRRVVRGWNQEERPPRHTIVGYDSRAWDDRDSYRVPKLDLSP